METVKKDKILVVDDLSSDRYLIHCILTDYEVLEAENGSTMRTVLERELPVLIFLDVMMPGEDGFELARALRADIRYRDIPIVFVSARDSGDDVESGFSVGGDDYIKKPYEEAELRARMKSVLGKKRRERELKEKSMRDSLTMLYNHVSFMDLARQHIAQGANEGKSIALAILDIDYFKNVNDTFGHQAGDFILTNFSDLLKKNKRNHDIVGRYGGEEFVLLFYNSTRQQARESVERVRTIAETSTYEFQDLKLRYTFSAGVADTTENEQLHNIDDLLRAADM